MRYLMLGVGLLVAVLALLAALPGPILAAAEMATDRNMAWGTVVIITHGTAAFSALSWGVPILIRTKPGHGAWILVYVTAYLMGIYGLENMQIKFMM